MTHDLTGTVVAITGAARGIGLATARELLARGASVAIADVDTNALEQAAAELGVATYATLDVTDAQSFAAFLDQVERDLGPLDVLVNNAGIMPVGLLVEEPDDVTRRILDINVYGVILGSKLAAQRMVPRGQGHVINVASMAGEFASPGLATYTASKYAVVGFTDAARMEHRGAGVAFSMILPSFVNTELTAGTKGLRGFRSAGPEEIARGIAGLIKRPRPRIRRTRTMGALMVAQRFSPAWINEAIGRRLGGETVFLDDVDPAARRAYEQRARGN